MTPQDWQDRKWDRRWELGPRELSSSCAGAVALGFQRLPHLGTCDTCQPSGGGSDAPSEREDHRAKDTVEAERVSPVLLHLTRSQAEAREREERGFGIYGDFLGDSADQNPQGNRGAGLGGARRTRRSRWQVGSAHRKAERAGLKGIPRGLEGSLAFPPSLSPWSLNFRYKLVSLLREEGKRLTPQPGPG